MTIKPIPPVRTLIDSIVGVAASYRVLYTSQLGELDPRFRRSAERVLTMIAVRSGFGLNPRLERFCGADTRTQHNLFVADCIMKKPTGSRPQWQVFSVEASSADFQTLLWKQIMAAADGFIKAGYNTYVTPEAPGGWATKVLEQT